MFKKAFEHNRMKLTEFLELDYGLLDKLRDKDVLTPIHVNAIMVHFSLSVFRSFYFIIALGSKR